MPSSREALGATVLRGERAAALPRARVDVELRATPFVRSITSDTRLYDPSLVEALEAAGRTARELGTSQGYAAGYAEGVARAAVDEAAARAEREAAECAAAEQRARDVATICAALRAAAEDLEARAAPAYDSAVHDLGPAAYALICAVLGREPATPVAQVEAVLARVAAHAPVGADLTVHLHPEDARVLQTEGIDVSVAVGRAATVVADGAVPRGGGLVDSGATRLDVTLAQAVERVAAALLTGETP